MLTQPTHATQATTHQRIACANSDQLLFIQIAINQTLPTGYGQRNRRIFDFARKLRAVLDEASDPETLRPFVEDWHRAALVNIRTKDFLETWQDFLVAWENVRLPARRLLESVKNAAVVDQFTLGQGDTNLDNVAKVFRSAARSRGDGQTFYMDYRTVASCVGLSPVAALTSGVKLVAMKVLIIVENGTIGMRGKATVWRWVGP